MLIWPSVKDSDPTILDVRTTHGALPVISGQKYSANLWVWLGPHQPAHTLNCVASPIADGATKHATKALGANAHKSSTPDAAVDELQDEL